MQLTTIASAWHLELLVAHCSAARWEDAPACITGLLQSAGFTYQPRDRKRSPTGHHTFFVFHCLQFCLCLNNLFFSVIPCAWKDTLSRCAYHQVTYHNHKILLSLLWVQIRVLDLFEFSENWASVVLMMAVFWFVAPCSLVEVYWRFTGPCWLHHQGEDSHLRTHHRENLKSYLVIIMLQWSACILCYCCRTQAKWMDRR
jgi:hypothetical protein